MGPGIGFLLNFTESEWVLPSFFFTGLYRDGMACRAACVFQKDNWRSLSVSSFIFFLLVSSNERVGSEMAFLASDSGCEPHPQARPFFLIIFFYRVYWVFEHFHRDVPTFCGFFFWSNGL